MLKSVIEKRRIPLLPDIADTGARRQAMLDMLAKEEYGDVIPAPDKLSFETKLIEGENYLAGKAALEEITVTAELNGVQFSFPFKFAYRTNAKNQRVIVHANFRSDVPDKYLPVEEIIDRGFAVAQFCYDDVTMDNHDFTHGMAKALYPDGKREYPTAPGKIRMWAWAASRVLDYLEALDFVDKDNFAVVGHSRLGKTALVAGAFDERFKFVHSNDSGCGGGAIFRDKKGERVVNMEPKLEHWFCPSFEQYADNEHAMPFDQHWLVGAIAPRYVEIGTAIEDEWADPESEFLTCVMASDAYEKMGLDGFIHNGKFPELGEHLKNGHISFYVREGKHAFSRYDWNKFIDFIEDK